MAFPSLEPRGSLDGSDSWTEVDELPPRTPVDLPMPAFRPRAGRGNVRPSRRDSGVQVTMDLQVQSDDSVGEGRSA